MCFVFLIQVGGSFKKKNQFKMGLRRPGVTKDYEEMPGANVPTPSKHLHSHHNHLHNQIHSNPHSQRSIPQSNDMSICQDLEMSSVSVVPDG